MSKCTDSKLGALLHAYELKALSDEDVERFEIHLLECEFCFEQLKDFEVAADLLVSDKEVKELIKEYAPMESSHPEPYLKKLWQNIWPETSLIFKPALAYLLILLLILPAYYGLKRSTQEEIRPITQTINLMPFRSVGEDVFKISLGKDGVISFLFEDAVAGQSYQVAIESEDGRVAYKNDTFREFDANRTGRLLLPLVKMKIGNYSLVITDPRTGNRQEYTFQIKK
jgi:hypothetical protein